MHRFALPHNVIVLGAALLASSVLATGCSQNNIVGMKNPLPSTQTVKKTKPPSRAVIPTPTTRPVSDHLSRLVGIGDSVKWVESKWGKPNKVVTPLDAKGSGLVVYGLVTVSYETGRVSDIEKMFHPAADKQTVKTFISNTLPKDAREESTWTAGSNPATVYYIYSAESIKKVFSGLISPIGAIKVQLIPASGTSGTFRKVVLSVDNGVMQ